MNIGWPPNEEKPNEQMNKLGWNLGQRPNDKKSKEQTISLDRTWDGIPMMRN